MATMTARRASRRRKAKRQAGDFRVVARHRVRVVRLLHLRHARRHSGQQVLRRRRADLGLHLRAARLRGRLRGAPVRRAGVRPARRSGRPQIHLPRHHDLDGHRHVHGRPAADLRDDRHRGADPAHRLRLVQGLALGGEYGGAATYVAEHAPKGKRGFYTSWIQTTATLGLFLSLLVILALRTAMGEAAFAAWGWRIPFLLSIILLGFSIWIRLQLAESPGLPEDEGRRHAVEGAADGSVRQLGQRQDRAPRAARRHRRPGGRLVRRTVLRAVLPDADPQGATARRRTS